MFALCATASRSTTKPPHDRSTCSSQAAATRLNRNTHQLSRFDFLTDARLMLHACLDCTSYSVSRVVLLARPCEKTTGNTTHHNRFTQCLHPATKEPLRRQARVLSASQLRTTWPHVTPSLGVSPTLCHDGLQPPPGPEVQPAAQHTPDEWPHSDPERGPSMKEKADLEVEYAFWASQ